MSLPVCTALPQIATLPETKEVTVGSDARLPCVASGYPVPEIKWSKVMEWNSINKVCRSSLCLPSHLADKSNKIKEYASNAAFNIPVNKANN